MIDSPGLELRARSASGFAASGKYAQRVDEFARCWARFYERRALPACELAVLHAGPQHSGLGVGTQLALSVAAALHAWENEPCPPALQLARSVQRGLRSAIGVYGFLEGGLIVERGRWPEEPLSPLDCRFTLPEAWRVVLCCPLGVSGLSGTAEYDAFRRLPAVDRETTQRLVCELRERLLPAALQGDFHGLSESIYRYGHEAGMCFAAVQGGPYNGPLVTQMVDHLRARGVVGVGQSSWGPTVFALQPDPETAEQLARELRSEPLFENVCIQIATVARHGARIR